jgi:exodeoxyribonuclease III
VRLITWNVARRIARLGDQAAALASRDPDVVALQEVTARGHGLWLEALARIGLPHVTYSPGPRMGVLLAAREPLAPVEPLPVPRADSTAAGIVAGIAFHTVHVPNAANGWVKVRTLEAVRAGLAAAQGPRVLCGDLNTPRRESPDGTVLSFARDSKGRLREERGTEWDDGELGVVPRLAELGFKDAIRALHGYAKPERSWTFPGDKGGWRLDHAFLSAELELHASRYHHDWRVAGLSDHSALEVDLSLPAGSPPAAR